MTDTLDENWSNVQKQFERIQNPSSNGNGNGTTHHNSQIDLRDLFEERLRRPMNSATMQNLATTALRTSVAISIFRSTPSLSFTGPLSQMRTSHFKASPSSCAMTERLLFGLVCPTHDKLSRQWRQALMESKSGQSSLRWNAIPKNSSQ